MSTIAILPGSVRPEGNCPGLAAWLSTHLTAVLSDSPSEPTPTQILTLTPSNSPLPLGPILSSLIAAGHPPTSPSSHYTSSSTSQWSALVSSFSALIILTPQYNRGYPGELKNTLDHLYFEWRDLPTLIVTYGGHGGGKCGKQLKEVCEDGLRMKLVRENVEVTLPERYIRGSDRVSGEDEFLREYEDKLVQGLKELVGLMKEKARQ